MGQIPQIDFFLNRHKLQSEMSDMADNTKYMILDMTVRSIVEHTS